MLQTFYDIEHGDNTLSAIGIITIPDSTMSIPLYITLEHQVQILTVSGARRISKSIKFDIRRELKYIKVETMVGFVTNKTFTTFKMRE
jgi:hypothetical protein